MTTPAEAVATFLRVTYRESPRKFPVDEHLTSALEESNWQRVFNILVRIRDSETVEERIGNRRQMTTQPSNLAEKLLIDVIDVYERTKLEREIASKLEIYSQSSILRS